MITTSIGTDINEAARLLKAGEVVAIPTETVYGLAGNAFNEQAINKIFQVKNRPLHNPLIVHVRSRKDIPALVEEFPAVAEELLIRFSPGPLTILLPIGRSLPSVVNGGRTHVALRIPNHPVTLSLLELLPFPLVAPSANLYTRISPTTPAHVLEQLGGKIHYILDGGHCTEGIESTVVGFDKERIIIYRPGSVTLEDLQATGREVVYNSGVAEGPGMDKLHYAPTTKLILTNDINEWRSRAGEGIAFISFTQPAFNSPNLFVLSASGSIREAALNLYDSLHAADKLPVNLIVAELVPGEGIGKAINDRLRRAAGHG
jgi:L-threonylcarbamoyladenylate synthase